MGFESILSAAVIPLLVELCVRIQAHCRLDQQTNTF